MGLIVESSVADRRSQVAAVKHRRLNAGKQRVFSTNYCRRESPKRSYRRSCIVCALNVLPAPCLNNTQK